MTTADAGVPELDGAPLFLLDDARRDGDELLVDGDEGRHAVDVLRLTAGRAGARRRRPAAPVADGDGRRRRTRRACGSRCAAAFEVPAADAGVRAGAGAAQGRPRAARRRPGHRARRRPDRAVDGVPLRHPLARATGSRRALAKWRAAARAASKQSRRPRLPEVTEPMTTREVCGLLADADLAARAARAGPPSARRAGRSRARAPSPSSSGPRAG